MAPGGIMRGMRHVFRLALRVAIVLPPLLAGSPATADETVGKAIRAATTEATTRPVAAAPIPIVYLYPKKDHPLTQKTVDKLLAAATESEAAHDGRRPWFIAVHQNHDASIGAVYRVMLYFSPDTATERARTGRFLLLWWYTRDDITVREYVQVSRPRQPFGKRLETPEIGDLPYEVEQHIDPAPADPKWVEFIDFARPLLAKEDDPYPPYLIARGKKDTDVYALADGTDEGGIAIKGEWTKAGFAERHLYGWSGSPWGELQRSRRDSP
jgi:hypothetical protein